MENHRKNRRWRNRADRGPQPHKGRQVRSPPERHRIGHILHQAHRRRTHDTGGVRTRRRKPLPSGVHLLPHQGDSLRIWTPLLQNPHNTPNHPAPDPPPLQQPTTQPAGSRRHPGCAPVLEPPGISPIRCSKSPMNREKPQIPLWKRGELQEER